MVDFVTNLARRRNIATPLLISAAGHCLLGLLAVAMAGHYARVGLGIPDYQPTLAAIVFLGVCGLVFWLLDDHNPWSVFGPANRITVARAVIIALVAGAVGAAPLDVDHAWVLTGLAAAALAMDGLDGWAARRSGMASRFGARFDMELDALFILVLAILAHDMGKAGAWVILAGGLRYLFQGAGWVWPHLRTPLPASGRRQAVCAIQVAVLVACLMPALGPEITNPLAAAALALLTTSFAADIVWLIYGRRHRQGGKS